MKTAPSTVPSKIESPDEKSTIPTVHSYKGAGHLAEIYQSMGLKIALMKKNEDDTYNIINTHCLCLDFIVDQFAADEANHKFSIYGYSWDGKSEKMDWSKLYLHLKFPDTKAKQNFKKNIHFLHEIEDKNNLERTVYQDTKELNGIVIANKTWLNNAITLRLYLFFLRVLCHSFKTKDWLQEFGNARHSDSQYIKYFDKKSLERILDDINSINTDYFAGLSMKSDVHAYHHNSGIFSVFSRHGEQSASTVKRNKHWIEMRKRGFETYIK